MKCPICEKGELKKGTTTEEMFGVVLGTFPALVCSKCGESFTDEATTKSIEESAKKKGVWGLGKTTKITKTGNSLSVRIPKEMADRLGIKDGEDAFIHPEKNRLVIDIKD